MFRSCKDNGQECDMYFKIKTTMVGTETSELQKTISRSIFKKYKENMMEKMKESNFGGSYEDSLILLKNKNELL